MPNTSPPWVTVVQVGVTVENVTIIPEPATEAPAGSAGNYTGDSTSYQTVATWTVSESAVGELKEIIVLTNNYDKTLVKIDIGDTTWCEDWAPQSVMPVIFEDLKIAAETVVTVSAKSSDGSALVVDAIIVGKEVA